MWPARLLAVVLLVAAAPCATTAADVPATAVGRDDVRAGISLARGNDGVHGSVDRTIGSGAGGGDQDLGGPSIDAVYPNPVADGDRGEFVVLTLPDGPGARAANWSLRDGEATVRLPSGVAGTVAVSPNPAAAVPFVDVPVRPVDAALALANGGETLALLRDGRVVDTLAYGSAPAGERYLPSAGFVPLGVTDLPVVQTDGARVTAFVLPDAPTVPVDVLRSASRRILLAGYTLTSRRVVRALVAAADRGVAVSVLVEGGPVGGITAREAALLDRLVAAGVPVRAVGGPRARVDFHHAKYAVVDDRALVVSENWKPSGTGGRSSRGWGAVVDDPRVAAHLARVFRADAGWLDAVPWREFRRGRSFASEEVAAERYPARVAPATLTAERVRVLVAPDNAEAAILALLSGARESILVQQVSLGGPDHPLVRATLAAARRGVEVRILLSSAWYAREENERLVDRLRSLADTGDLPLSARLADPRSRFEKVHNKGLIVDGEHVLVGSVNWNNHSLRENREVALLLDGEAVAGYYAAVFRADWRGPTDRVPYGLLAVVVAVAALAGRVGRGFEFERGG